MARKSSLLSSVALIALAALLFGFPAKAASYTVNAGGGGNYTTITACIAAMSASGGDTCTVFAGTYAETPTLKAGTAGNYNVVQANAGDTVNVLGWTAASHTKIIGFNITNPSSPSVHACVAMPSNGTDIYVTNNTMYACGNGSMVRAPFNSNTTHVYVQGNTMSYGCSTSSAPNVCQAFLLNGDYNLIENNNMSHMSDGMEVYGDHDVLRGNVFHDLSSSDCGTNSSNCHIDMFQFESNTAGGIELPSTNLLIEGNYEYNNFAVDGHGGLTQGDSCGGLCSHAIIRYNHGYIIATFWLLDNLGDFSHVKDYNNTIVCAMHDGGQCGQSNADTVVTSFETSSNGAEVNNIYYDSTNNNQNIFVAGLPPFRENNNLVYMNTCGTACTFLSPFNTEVGRVFNQDPKFVDPASNWNLQAGSPAIGAGAALSAVSSASGTGTSLTVTDADYFQDGTGLTAVGVAADWIRIGASTTVQISAVNYSTNTLTLASSVSWNQGDPVYLYKRSDGEVVLNGAAPDIGAFPYQPTALPVPPTSLSAVVR